MNDRIDSMTQLIQGIIENKKEDFHAKEYELHMKFLEMSAYENDLINQNVHLIAGIDEVGRGPIAGPVVASAVILPTDFYLPGINDSKQLSIKKREYYFEEIIKHAISYGIGVATVEEIDSLNIYNSTKLAMKRAVYQLSIKPKHLLIDAMKLDIDIEQTGIIKGDAKSISIAAASIVAKVTRDLYMKKLDGLYPHYYFGQNAGYGTKQHIEAVYEHGVLPEHRKTFEPIKSLMGHKKTLFDL